MGCCYFQLHHNFILLWRINQSFKRRLFFFISKSYRCWHENCLSLKLAVSIFSPREYDQVDSLEVKKTPLWQSCSVWHQHSFSCAILSLLLHSPLYYFFVIVSFRVWALQAVQSLNGFSPSLPQRLLRRVSLVKAVLWRGNSLIRPTLSQPACSVQASEQLSEANCNAY